MIKKTDLVKAFVHEKNYKEALKIAKGFKLNISKEDRDTLTTAYECIVHPYFYLSLGLNTDILIKEGIELVCRLYG